MSPWRRPTWALGAPRLSSLTTTGPLVARSSDRQGIRGSRRLERRRPARRAPTHGLRRCRCGRLLPPQGRLDRPGLHRRSIPGSTPRTARRHRAERPLRRARGAFSHRGQTPRLRSSHRQATTARAIRLRSRSSSVFGTLESRSGAGEPARGSASSSRARVGRHHSLDLSGMCRPVAHGHPAATDKLPA
jgi:hypothetical protein